MLEVICAHHHAGEKPFNAKSGGDCNIVLDIMIAALFSGDNRPLGVKLIGVICREPLLVDLGTASDAYAKHPSRLAALQERGFFSGAYYDVRMADIGTECRTEVMLTSTRVEARHFKTAVSRARRSEA